MRGLPRERWFDTGSEAQSLLEGDPVRPDVEEPFRQVRNGTLPELLDQEFSRNYRFEGWSDFFHDLKGFIRKVVVREDEEDCGELMSGDR